MRSLLIYPTRVATTLVLVCLLAACGDSAVSDGGDDGMTRISGVVTDDTASKAPNTASKAAAEVDDATVSGKEVDDSGNTRPSDGETRTNDRGEYVLETDASTNFVLVSAVKNGFESRVLVDTRVSGTVGAAEMTGETTTEADVFVEARRQNDDHVTAADVAAYVDANVAARVRTGVETAARVAVAIGNAERARATFAAEHGFTNTQSATDEEDRAYREYQNSMTGHASASVAAEASARLETRTARSHLTAGANATLQAQANETARAALVAFSAGLNAEVRTALRRRAEIQAAIATTHAIESELRASGSGNASADAVAQAGLQLQAAIRAASDVSVMADAWADFRTEVHENVAAEMGVSLSTVTAALTGLLAVESTLNLSLQSASSVDAVVEAKSAFYAQAESQLKSSFNSNARAEAAARILAVVESY